MKRRRTFCQSAPETLLFWGKMTFYLFLVSLSHNQRYSGFILHRRLFNLMLGFMACFCTDRVQFTRHALDRSNRLINTSVTINYFTLWF
uniref:Uncharacterized protein n=1 Tax=Pararge aegeria TaxID=116150 RepID=S4NWC7_9NEOP